MGAPQWTEEERIYFIDYIMPRSKYAGGNYSNSRGLEFHELAPMMQDELDRKGASRRRYTGDVLFQHYYQKCSSRAYDRGEGDHVAIPNGPRPRTTSGSMGPPPQPTSARRPATKRPSMSVNYRHATTQTSVAIEAGSESERAVQGWPQYSGPPAALYGDTFTAESNLEVQPIGTPTNKRKYQAFITDEEDEDLYTLKDISLEEEKQPLVRKKQTVNVRTDARGAENRTGDGIFNSMDEISNLLGHQTSEPQRHRSVKLVNPWVQSFGTRPGTPLGGARDFTSPRSDTHSVGTNSLAFRTYTPSPSFDRPPSASDTSRPARHRRSLARSLWEEASRASTRASDRRDSSHGAFEAVPSPLREPSRSSNKEKSDIRSTSPTICSPAVGASRTEYRDDSHTADFIQSPQHKSLRAASYRDESQTSQGAHSSSRTPVANGTSRHEAEDEWYTSQRQRSIFDPIRYQGLGSQKQGSDHDDDEPNRRFVPRSSRFSPPHETRADDTPSPIMTHPCSSVTGGRMLLPSFRKRSKIAQEFSASPTQPQRTITSSRPAKRRVDFDPFIRSDDR